MACGVPQLTRFSALDQGQAALSLQKDAPLSRSVRRFGRVLSVPLLAGLHHQYVRV
jgi:hypothetical protein